MVSAPLYLVSNTIFYLIWTFKDSSRFIFTISRALLRAFIFYSNLSFFTYSYCILYSSIYCAFILVSWIFFTAFSSSAWRMEILL
jgi:hypothetical protein